MTGGTHLLLGIHGTELSPEEATLFRKLKPGGYILFSRNIADPIQTRRLTDELRSLSYDTPIIGIDQEGGRVARTGSISPPPPSAPSLSKSGDYAAIAEAATLGADQLRLLGVNMNMAPVLDLDHFPEQRNALTGRSWGRDCQRVIDYAGHWNRWHRKRGIKTCGKHFPAGGRAISDPHHDLPQSVATWDTLLADDVLAYTALMPELDAIMLAHMEFPEIDPKYPSSLSPRIVRDLLRGQLGFDNHLVLTDDLDMGAITKRYGRGEDARLAIAAGCDLALLCHHTDSAEFAAESVATLPGHILDDSGKRIDALRRKLDSPPDWSDSAWAEATAKLANLSDRFAEDHGGPTVSPVQEY